MRAFLKTIKTIFMFFLTLLPALSYIMVVFYFRYLANRNCGSPIVAFGLYMVFTIIGSLLFSVVAIILEILKRGAK